MEKNNFLESSILLIKSRKEIAFAITWITTCATIIAGKGIPPIINSFLVIISMLMLCLSVYIYNDITDREMDAFSKQDKKKGRPIAHGVVSVSYAKRFVYVTGLLGLALCFMINRIVFSIGAVYYIVLILYSYPGVRFKKKYVWKNIVTSLTMPAIFLIGGVAIEGKISPIIIFLSFTYYIFGFLVLPAIADSLDIEEDLEFNIKTIGNQLSWRKSVLLFIIGILLLVGSTVTSYLVFNMSYISPLLTTIIGVPVILYSVKLLSESGLTASYKLRPYGYLLVVLTPLIFTLGAVF
jgi:4-hydroxybenzoate polyprenyltransferase